MKQNYEIKRHGINFFIEDRETLQCPECGVPKFYINWEIISEQSIRKVFKKNSLKNTLIHTLKCKCKTCGCEWEYKVVE